MAAVSPGDEVQNENREPHGYTVGIGRSGLKHENSLAEPSLFSLFFSKETIIWVNSQSWDELCFKI